MAERRPPPTAPSPLFVSQLTSLPVLGIDARRFLELLRARPDIPRRRVGKLVLVSAGVAREMLDDLPVPTDANGSASAIAGVLDALGYQNVHGRGSRAR